MSSSRSRRLRTEILGRTLRSDARYAFTLDPGAGTGKPFLTLGFWLTWVCDAMEAAEEMRPLTMLKIWHQISPFSSRARQAGDVL